jgi:hypothetical protein
MRVRPGLCVKARTDTMSTWVQHVPSGQAADEGVDLADAEPEPGQVFARAAEVFVQVVDHLADRPTRRGSRRKAGYTGGECVIAPDRLPRSLELLKPANAGAGPVPVTSPSSARPGERAADKEDRVVRHDRRRRSRRAASSGP